ncbi:MAG TPA: pyridoxal-phosphate dependent enzyme [Chitinophagaceae bacterium]
MFFPALQNIRLDSLKNLYQTNKVEIDVLRLDLIHKVISGNKWFKLKEYLHHASIENKNTILTFGGAYSNHIIATAAACRESKLQSIGIIRGEKPQILSHTLIAAEAYGMELFYTSRYDYKAKIIPETVWNKYPKDTVLIINEGGYGLPGRMGAATISNYVKTSGYTHLLAAVGTGTTLAGLISSFHVANVIGIPVMKNNNSLQQEINTLLPESLHNMFNLIHDYHFGGYAKSTKELFQFMNEWFTNTNIPSDFVYTGKLFYAADHLIKSGYFRPGSKLLLIHSGGLQGNLSLPKGTLIF